MPPDADQPPAPPTAAPAVEQAQLDAVLRQLPVGVLIARAPDGRVVSANARAHEIFGVESAAGGLAADAARWPGRRPDGRPYAGGDLPLARAVHQGAVVTRERIVFEGPDGRQVTTEVSAAPVRDADGTVVAGVAVIEDVSARVATEAAERAAAARAERLQRVTAALAKPLSRQQVADVFAAELPAAFGTAYTWLAAVSDDGRRLDVLAARDDRGAVPDAWSPLPTDGATVVAAVSGDGRPRVYRSRAALLAERPEQAAALPPGHEAALALPLRNDGHVLAVAWLAFTEPRAFLPDELAHAEALATQCAQALERARLYQEERALRAEAERQRAEAEAARRAAEQANRTKSEFLAIMSHELRTPLNAIAGYAQLLDLEMAGPLTPQQRDYLTRLAASGQHLLGLVTDVLDLAKLDAERVAVARDALPVRGATAAALSVVLPLAEAKRVRLVDATEREGDLAYLGDEHRVRQVLINLLSNAVKFTPAGGTVELRAARAAGPAHGPGGEGRGPYVALTVRDTGIGVPRELQPAVFEPFVQAEGGHTRAHGGTGLGLTISRRLARLMGGDLTLESEPGAGAAFTLWLPAVQGTEPADVAEPPPAGVGESPAAAPPTPEVRREVAGYRARGLSAVAGHLRAHLEEVIARFVLRMRRDPVIAPAAADRAGADLEDHALAFLGDVLQSLGVLDGGAESERQMLQDGADVQRALSERHGRQRYRLGFTAEQLAREYALLGEEIAAAVRLHVPEGAGDADAALATLARLLRRAAEQAARGHRRAALEATGEYGTTIPPRARG